MIEDVVIGTEKKLSVTIEPTEEFDTSKGGEFEVVLFCTNTISVTKTKSELTPAENRDNTYIITFNTAELGCGRVKARVITYIQDKDFEDGYRTEIYDFITKYNIINGLK